jgi:Tetratricopeptide repeat
MAAWFAPDAIPRSVFSAERNILAEVLSERVTVSDLAIEKALGELDKFSFIRLTAETVSMHPLLQAVEQDSQDSMGANERERWLVLAARLFNAFAPASPNDVRTWDVWLPLSPHAQTLIEHTIRHGIDSLSIPVLANHFGLFLNERAAYAQAEPLFRRALAISEKQSDQPLVATIHNNLAQLLKDTNRLGEAEPLMRRWTSGDEQQAAHGENCISAPGSDVSDSPAHQSVLAANWRNLRRPGSRNSVARLQNSLPAH